MSKDNLSKPSKEFFRQLAKALSTQNSKNWGSWQKEMQENESKFLKNYNDLKEIQAFTLQD